jgi:type II secretory pathway component PulJ
MNGFQKMLQGAPARQHGLSLIETMLALAIGLVVTGAMVAMMANTMGSGTRTIEMSRLQQEMRAAMQLITRDVRRSAYNAEAILCFGNLDCATDGTFPNGLTGDLLISSANDCVVFELDRDHDGDPTNDAPGGFRRVTDNGVGVIQMWAGSGDTDCSSGSSGWVAVTNPEYVNVSEFLACLEIDADDPQCSGVLADGSADPNMPASLSYLDLVDDDDGSGSPVYQRVRKLQLRITANLVDNNEINKTLIDRIHIRNNIVL